MADRNPNDIDTTKWIVPYVRKKLIDQLHAMNLTPDSLDYLVASHTHSDHIGNGNYFKNSVWIIDKYELDWAFRKGNLTENYDSLRTAKKITFTDNYDVFGDKSVIIHSIPGHTPGHMCLQIKLKNKTIFLSGDLYHFKEQRESKRVPKFNFDVNVTLKSVDMFERLVKQTKATVIIQHDRADYAKLPIYPNYWE